MVATSLLMNININLMNVKRTAGCWLSVMSIWPHKHCAHSCTQKNTLQESTAGHGSVNYSEQEPSSVLTLDWCCLWLVPCSPPWQMQSWRSQSLLCLLTHYFVNDKKKWGDTASLCYSPLLFESFHFIFCKIQHFSKTSEWSNKVNILSFHWYCFYYVLGAAFVEFQLTFECSTCVIVLNACPRNKN